MPLIQRCKAVSLNIYLNDLINHSTSTRVHPKLSEAIDNSSSSLISETTVTAVSLGEKNKA